VAQDRLAEKRRCRSLGLATAPFDAEVSGFPRLVKTRFGGFDGRGQRWVHDHAELAEALAELPDPIVEGPVVFRRELALTVARGLDGAMRAFPLAETEHRHGILWRATAPARVTAEQVTEATAIGEALAESLDYVGVLAVELFDTADGLVVNELAPRVHNSGHWTIDGAVTSQFEQHVRAVCGLPLGDPSAIGVSVMVNAVGGEPTDAVLAIDGVHVHRYGKQSRPGRKVGHVTVNAPSLAGAEATAARVAELVQFRI
jgi:5-(carboxyamino)imidazole ribonucleotide synthase